MHIEPTWSGQTVAILASGPSLRANDVAQLRGRCRVIVIKDAARLAPWCDIMYGGDAPWWRVNDYGRKFHVKRIGLAIRDIEWEREATRNGLSIIQGRNMPGLSPDPRLLHLGYHSGFQAVNLAYLMGARKILLLGYDYCAPADKTHFFGCRPGARPSPYALFRHAFDGCHEYLSSMGVQVINCSAVTTLTEFPRLDLRNALREA